MVVASVLGGLAVLVALVAVAFQPFLLLVSLPLAAAAYLLWQGAVGNLGRAPWRRRRVDPRQQRRRREPNQRRSDAQASASDAAWGEAGDESRNGGGPRGAGSRRRGGQTGGNDGYWRGPTTEPSGLDRETAYRTLGLSPGADEETVRQAYRDRVKEVHPDAADGDEAEFKRVNRAYETLSSAE